MRASKRLIAVCVFISLTMTACIQTAPEVVKIGLVAPFEGRYREVGYDVIPAVRLAIREYAAQNPDANLTLELVAYDDSADLDRAVEQAQRLITDPDVKLVIGHWREDTTAAALHVYHEANIPVITLSTQPDLPPGAVYNLAPTEEDMDMLAEEWGSTTLPRYEVQSTTNDVLAEAAGFPQSGEFLIGGPIVGLSQYYQLSQGAAEQTYFVSPVALPSDTEGQYWTESSAGRFSQSFTDANLGAPPGIYSAAAYEAAWLAISYVMQQYSIEVTGTPADNIEFDSSGRRVKAPVYLYQWQGGQRVLIDRLN